MCQITNNHVIEFAQGLGIQAEWSSETTEWLIGSWDGLGDDMRVHVSTNKGAIVAMLVRKCFNRDTDGSEFMSEYAALWVGFVLAGIN